MSLDGALKVLPAANLALISVAGRYAGDSAMRALERGLHVMLFSDNVPLEQEIELKQFARKRGLLVMGPDCGTAIINGVPLAFANAVNRGSIGIVAAAGTGPAGGQLHHLQRGRRHLPGHRHRRTRREAGGRRHHVHRGAQGAGQGRPDAGDPARLQAAAPASAAAD